MSFLDSLEGWVTDAMNEEFSKVFTREEIANALRQMHSIKAPGPDGMLPLFFQKYWHEVGDLVIEVVFSALQTGHIPLA